MPNIIYYSKTIRKNLVKINFLVLIILLLKISNCEEGVDQELVQTYDACINSLSSLIMNNEQCFNNILKFDHKNYQTSNFAKNKNGDLVIEFSEDDELSSSRLFYGLTKDGRYFFKNQSSYTYELNIDNEILDNFGYFYFDSSYKTTNLFVSIKNDPNKGNQYLFSINSYYSTVELHDFNNDANDTKIFNNNSNHYIWSFNDFFNLDEDDYIFPYDYSLFELAKENAYIISFIPKVDVFEDILSISFIKKFRFKSFDINSFEEIKSVDYADYDESRIITSFLMEDIGLFGVISFKGQTSPGNIFSRRLDCYGYQGVFLLKLYNNNLKALNFGNDLSLDQINLCNNLQEDLFLKPIYLKDKFSMIIYFSDYTLCFEMHKFDYKYGTYRIRAISYNVDRLEGFLSDIIKINEKKIIFICTNIIHEGSNLGGKRNLEISSNKLNIFIINIMKNINNPNSLVFSIDQKELFDFTDYIPTIQMSGFIYNDYFLLSTTYKNIDDYYDDNNNYFSMFMIFGYANGTDSTIDIYYFLNDLGNNQNNQNNNIFFEFLYKNLTIENNIFGYIPENMIKLVSKPKEILIVKQDQDELIYLQNNSLMNRADNYLLQQNINLTKTSKYYYMDYQYIVKEIIEINNDPPGGGNARIGERLTPSPSIRNLDNSNEEALGPETKIYHGRTNRLKFKLCHEYCETCYELGINNNEQKCSSCHPMYQYDYWYYYNNTQGNCVPEGYYNDLETNILHQCNLDETKFYINVTDNKTICFKDDYPCPDSYSSFNSSTKECFYCDYSRYKIGECSLNDGNNNNTAEDIYEKVKNELILEYNNEDNFLKINTGGNYIYQITSIDNELKYLRNNMRSQHSVIDLKECADILKRENGLDPNTDLIILKYENENETISNGNEKSIQYEVYAPNSTTKLDLSVCSDVKIDIYIPIQLSEETMKLYEDLKAQGYNLFDKNDKFYTDICTPYKSENDTDVLLFYCLIDLMIFLHLIN